MRLSSDEKQLLTVLALSLLRNAPEAASRAVSLAGLGQFFDRPAKLKRAVCSLERWCLITHDPFKNEVRLLLQAVSHALSAGPVAAQPVLFDQERPLDGPLALVNAVRANLHSARVPEHAHVTGTFNRQNVSTIKRLTSDRGDGAVKSVTARPEAVFREVAEFVGQDDFQRHWANQKFFEDGQRLEILSGSLRYLRAGIKAGDIKTKTSPGRHLWNQFQHDCRAKGISARCS